MASEGGIVKLVSHDGDEYEVPADVARMSGLVNDTLNELETEGVKSIPLPNVRSIALEKVVEFMAHHKEEPMTRLQKSPRSSHLEELVQAWYVQFVSIDPSLLWQLAAAADYMNIEELLGLSCVALAIQMKGKTAAEELRKLFNITDDGSVVDMIGLPSSHSSSDSEGDLEDSKRVSKKMRYHAS